MQNSQSPVITKRTQDLIEKLLLGRLSVPEIAKVTGISEQWLQTYVNAQYEFISQRRIS
jgi:AraC-like DNA-binding protein